MKYTTILLFGLVFNTNLLLAQDATSLHIIENLLEQEVLIERMAKDLISVGYGAAKDFHKQDFVTATQQQKLLMDNLKELNEHSHLNADLMELGMLWNIFVKNANEAELTDPHEASKILLLTSELSTHLTEIYNEYVKSSNISGTNFESLKLLNSVRSTIFTSSTYYLATYWKLELDAKVTTLLATKMKNCDRQLEHSIEKITCSTSIKNKLHDLRTEWLLIKAKCEEALNGEKLSGSGLNRVLGVSATMDRDVVNLLEQLKVEVFAMYLHK